MRLATQTMKAIEDQMKADQGNAFRYWLQRVLPHMGDAYRQDEAGHRAHLGASVIGGSCPRDIWYSFRWAKLLKFDGRLLRLFNRGHLEEARFIACLLAIGVEVFQQDATGKQFRINDVDGHFGGSGDGIARGIPDLGPDQYVLLEFKTHNRKSFDTLKAQGVRSAKPEHYVQMNVYMRKMGLAVALYMAVCKDTDEIHAELVELDPECADMYLERARNIIWLSKPPQGVSDNAGYWECRYCDYRRLCHMGDTSEVDRNCRTCQHGRVAAGGVFECARDGHRLDVAAQHAACEHYRIGEAFNRGV